MIIFDYFFFNKNNDYGVSFIQLLITIKNIKYLKIMAEMQR